MRFVVPPINDPSLLEAASASIRRWLIAMLAWFCDVVDAMPTRAWRYAIVRDAYAAAKQRIAKTLRRDTHVLRTILFLHANARFRFATGRIRIDRIHRGVRGGLRAGRRRPPVWRTVTAGVVCGMHQGSLRARVQRLRAMLDNPERLIRRVLKRLAAIWRVPHGRGLVLTSAHDACENRAPQSAPAFANSS